MLRMNRRTFIQRCFAVAGGVFAVFAPGKKKESVIVINGTDEVRQWDSMLLEDNGTYKCIPGSGPQHYVGQVLKYRNKRKSIICTKVSDSHSLWKEVNEHTLEVKPKPKIMNKVDIDEIYSLLTA